MSADEEMKILDSVFAKPKKIECPETYFVFKIDENQQEYIQHFEFIPNLYNKLFSKNLVKYHICYIHDVDNFLNLYTSQDIKIYIQGKTIAPLYKNIYAYTMFNIPIDWSSFFILTSGFLQIIGKYLEQTDKIVPSFTDVFRIFHLIKPEEIKVVILGQDPYPNKNADGIAFSSRTEIQPSLKNIFIELENEGFNVEKNSDLTRWVKRGIFLVNTAFTTEEQSKVDYPHAKIWASFTECLLQYINHTSHPHVILFGLKAKKYKKYFDSDKVHIHVHPSPLSAHTGFFGCNVFKNINEKIDINWY